MDGKSANSSQKQSFSDEYINLENTLIGKLDRLFSDSKEEAEIVESNQFD